VDLPGIAWARADEVEIRAAAASQLVVLFAILLAALTVVPSPVLEAALIHQCRVTTSGSVSSSVLLRK
jgi:hypothetical protein